MKSGQAYILSLLISPSPPPSLLTMCDAEHRWFLDEQGHRHATVLFECFFSFSWSSATRTWFFTPSLVCESAGVSVGPRPACWGAEAMVTVRWVACCHGQRRWRLRRRRRQGSVRKQRRWCVGRRFPAARGHAAPRLGPAAVAFVPDTQNHSLQYSAARDSH